VDTAGGALIIHVIRTNKVPFLQSRPSWQVLVMGLVTVTVGVGLPFSPVGRYFGFRALPPLYWPLIAATPVGYLSLTQAMSPAPTPACFVVIRSVIMIQATTNRHLPARSLVPFLPVRTWLEVIEPMLGDLETATTAGQHYVMGKVLAQLREALVGAEHKLPDLQRRTVRNTLAMLGRESERMLPDADLFARSVRMLADALSAT
jgi:hypothetical protein